MRSSAKRVFCTKMNTDVSDENFRNCDVDCLRQVQRAAQGEVMAGKWLECFIRNPFFVMSAVCILQSEIGRKG
jgi:hypothetical protein